MMYAAPILFALITWWAGTSAVLWLSNQPAEHHRIIGRAAVVFIGVATLAVYMLRELPGLEHAYTGFLLGVFLWGCHELLFLLGFVSGSRKTPCPPDLSPSQRLRASIQAISHHETALALHAVFLVAISLGGSNGIAAATFVILWGMRISAKLLVFFGAPNIPANFLPSHLKYLSSYFRRKRHFPAAGMAIALTTSVVVSMLFMVRESSAADLSTHTGLILLTTLAVLAVFEHVALVVTLPDKSLFAWALAPAPHNNKHTHNAG